MKSRFSLTLLLLAVLAFVSVNFFQLIKAENNQSTEIQSVTEQLNPITDSKNLAETKTPTEAQKAIPDEVAFEVFLRTVGENNARQLLVNAGFDENRDSDKIEQIMSKSKLLNDFLENLDKQAKEIKISKDGGKNFLADANVKSRLAELQSDKTTILQQVISRNLQEATRFDNGWNKLQNYARTTVKSQMQIIDSKSVSRSKPQKKDVAFIKTSAGKSVVQTQVGDAYLYSAAWSDGQNIFGSGTITERYSSGTSYAVTATVTSPSGRTNTTTSDWNYATLENNTGLSKSLEDGTYNVQATFDADAGGYYDEWGNYYSYGTYTVGSATSFVNVAPTVEVTQVQPPTATLRGASTAQTNVPREQIFQVTIAPSTEVRIGTTVGVQFVQRTITPASPTPKASVDDNSKTVTIAASNEVILVSFTVTADANSPNGTIGYRATIFSVVVPSGSPATGTGMADATVTIVGTPTPTPTPNPTPTPVVVGGGSCGSCGYAGLGCSGCANYGVYGYTNNGCASGFFNQYGCCCQGSPIVLDIDGNGYAMTNGANGVSFDLGGDGIKERTSWTAANSDDAWLALDRNDNHRIDDGKEVFGNYCDQPAPPPGVLRNGFSGLAEFDKAANGGDGDGKITRADTVFRRLRLWQDRNHNGVSEPEELSRLPALDVVAIFLDYRESRRTDEHGNRFKYRAKVRDARGVRVGRWAWDVFTVPPTN